MTNKEIQIIEIEIKLTKAALRTLKRELELLVKSKESSPETRAERTIWVCNIIGKESKLKALCKSIGEV